MTVTEHRSQKSEVRSQDRDTMASAKGHDGNMIDDGYRHGLGARSPVGKAESTPFSLADFATWFLVAEAQAKLRCRHIDPRTPLACMINV